MSTYEALLSSFSSQVGERASKYDFVRERHLQAMWLEQKYFKGLKSKDGEPIEVISPGIWNAEAGPDFKKAHLRIGEKELRGDVEIHLIEEGWTQHRHDKDPRYDEVVFHLALWTPNKPRQLLKHCGEGMEQACLEPFLTIPLSRIVNLIDLDLYPYKRSVGTGKCSHSLFRKLQKESIELFFHKAAEWRLKRKRLFLETRVENKDEALMAGISMALGYKNNADAFLKLFNWLSSETDKSEEELFASALEACGFFSEKYKKKWGDSPYFQKLANDLADPPPTISLSLDKIRPMNHPIRRIAYLTKLIKSDTFSGFYEKMTHYWNETWNKGNDRDLLGGLLDLIPTFADSYWNQHYTFEVAPKEDFIPLLGKNLKKEMVVNVILPLLYKEVCERGDLKEVTAFQWFYQQIPYANTSKSKYLIHRFFGDTNKSKILRSAFTEQGAYQLHRDFCIHFEASCEGCPFVERYHANFG